MKAPELHEALNNDQFTAIKEYVEQNGVSEMLFGQILDYALDDQNEPLVRALVDNAPESVKMPRTTYRNLRQALDRAVESQEKEIARALLEIGMKWYGEQNFPKVNKFKDWEKPGIQARSSAHEVVIGFVENGWISMAKKLLKAQTYYPQALVVQENYEHLPELVGYTKGDSSRSDVIAVALDQGRTEVVEELLERDNFTPEQAREGLRGLAADGKLDKLKKAVDDMGITPSFSSTTKYSEPIKQGHDQVVEYLVSLGLEFDSHLLGALIERDQVDDATFDWYVEHTKNGVELTSHKLASIHGGRFALQSVKKLLQKASDETTIDNEKAVENSTTDELFLCLKNDVLDKPVQFVKDRVFQADDPLIDPERVQSTLGKQARQKLLFEALDGFPDTEALDRFARTGWLDDQEVVYWPDKLNDELATHLQDQGATLREVAGAFALQFLRIKALDWLADHGMTAPQIPEAAYYAPDHERVEKIIDFHDRLKEHPEKQQHFREATEGKTAKKGFVYGGQEIMERGFPTPDDSREVLNKVFEGHSTNKKEKIEYLLEHGASVCSEHFYKALNLKEENEDVFRLIARSYEPSRTIMTRALNRSIKKAHNNPTQLLRVFWLADQAWAEADWSYVSDRDTEHDKKPILCLFEHYQALRRENRRISRSDAEKPTHYPLRDVLSLFQSNDVPVVSDPQTTKHLLTKLPFRLTKRKFARALIEMDFPYEKHHEVLKELIDYPDLLQHALKEGLDPNIKNGLLLDEALKQGEGKALEIILEKGGRAPLADRELVHSLANQVLEGEEEAQPIIKLLWADRDHHKPYPVKIELARRWKRKFNKDDLPALTGRQERMLAMDKQQTEAIKNE